jgi:hypothetical protein
MRVVQILLFSLLFQCVLSVVKKDDPKFDKERSFWKKFHAKPSKPAPKAAPAEPLDVIPIAPNRQKAPEPMDVFFLISEQDLPTLTSKQTLLKSSTTSLLQPKQISKIVRRSCRVCTIVLFQKVSLKQS